MILLLQCHPLVPAVLLGQLVLEVLAVQWHLATLADQHLPYLLADHLDLSVLMILENQLVLAVLVVLLVQVVQMDL